MQGHKLWHGQRIAREGFDVAAAAQDDLRLRLRDWSFARSPEGEYVAHVTAGDFSFELRCAPTQDVLLQGDGGLSRKGPRPQQASYTHSGRVKRAPRSGSIITY